MYIKINDKAWVRVGIKLLVYQAKSLTGRRCSRACIISLWQSSHILKTLLLKRTYASTCWFVHKTIIKSIARFKWINCQEETRLWRSKLCLILMAKTKMVEMSAWIGKPLCNNSVDGSHTEPSDILSPATGYFFHDNRMGDGGNQYNKCLHLLFVPR